ncbi:MAG: hypothetical protein ACYCZR_03760 [Burkholderiales bacterium]
MPVPVTIADLSATAASNSPAGAEAVSAAVGPDDYLRAHAAIIKTLASSVTTDIATAVSNHVAAADPHPLYALESALGTASTKDTGTASGNVPLVGTKSATESLAGLVELATQAEAEAGADNTVVMTPLKTAQAISALAIDVGTKQDSTSGVAIDFTGIPATAKRITMVFSGVSTNGTSLPIVRLGDAGGFEDTGYVGGASGNGVATTSTAGFLISAEGGGAYVFHGSIVLIKLSGNTWVSSACTGRSDNNNAYSCGGSKTLSDTLTQVRLTTVSGDTFDAGMINILVE